MFSEKTNMIRCASHINVRLKHHSQPHTSLIASSGDLSFIVNPWYDFSKIIK